MIQEKFILTATNADILSASRLTSIPYNGLLTVDVQSNLANATNNFALTIQKPNGDVPLDAQIVAGNNPSLDGVLDERTLERYTFQATQGGHFTLTATETGTAILTVRVTLKP